MNWNKINVICLVAQWDLMGQCPFLKVDILIYSNTLTAKMELSCEGHVSGKGHLETYIKVKSPKCQTSIM